jgi:hypothetical protein
MFVSLISLGVALLPFATAAVIDVQVGETGLTFTPDATVRLISSILPNVIANVYDSSLNLETKLSSTITQKTTVSPSHRLLRLVLTRTEESTLACESFIVECGTFPEIYSSFPVDANQTDFPTFTFNVVDVCIYLHHCIPISNILVKTNATWFYCAQAANTAASHCGAGMVFGVNCGPDGAANSFANFSAAALAIGASLSAAAPASTPAGAGGSSTWTAAYGGYTVPPAPVGVPVTDTITLDSSTWATSYTSYPNSPAPTPANLNGNIHTVTVGAGGQLLYNPPHIAALPRDIVVFEL